MELGVVLSAAIREGQCAVICEAHSEKTQMLERLAHHWLWLTSYISNSVPSKKAFDLFWGTVRGETSWHWEGPSKQ